MDEPSPKRQRRSLSPDSWKESARHQPEETPPLSQADVDQASSSVAVAVRPDANLTVTSSTSSDHVPLPVDLSTPTARPTTDAARSYGTHFHMSPIERSQEQSKSRFEAALLCQMPHPRSAPHPSQDLISLYDISKLALSVARKDPVTGEKINKLRKSYEGKLKNLGLPGRNKATDSPRELLGLLDLPDDNWEDQMMLRAKPLETATTGPLMEKLDRALSMQPGQLPKEEHENWKAVLAIDDGRPPSAPIAAKGAASSGAPSHLQTLVVKETGKSRPSSPVSGSLSARPERANKKRRYDDASFEGYAEGYRDDDGFGTGAGDDRRNSASRKRRRELSQGGFEPGTPTHLGDPSGSHQFGQTNTSMVGVKL